MSIQSFIRAEYRGAIQLLDFIPIIPINLAYGGILYASVGCMNTIIAASIRSFIQDENNPNIDVSHYIPPIQHPDEKEFTLYYVDKFLHGLGIGLTLWTTGKLLPFLDVLLTKHSEVFQHDLIHLDVKDGILAKSLFTLYEAAHDNAHLWEALMPYYEILYNQRPAVEPFFNNVQDAIDDVRFAIVTYKTAYNIALDTATSALNAACGLFQYNSYSENEAQYNFTEKCDYNTAKHDDL